MIDSELDEITGHTIERISDSRRAYPQRMEEMARKAPRKMRL